MNDLNSIVGKLGQSGLLSGLTGGLAAGTLVGALSSKTGRKMGKSALKVGAIAAVGGLAWKAYSSYSNNKQASPQGAHSNQNVRGSYNADSSHQHASQNHHVGAQLSYDNKSQDHFEQVVARDNSDNAGQILLLRAMISASFADGHIDSSEQSKIFDQVDNFDLSAEEKATIFDELRNPLSVDKIVDLVPDGETAIEVYTAALMAIDEKQPASADYLKALSKRLFIPSALLNEIHSEISNIKAA